MKLFKACSNSHGCVYVGADIDGSIIVSDAPEITIPEAHLAFTREEWEEFITAAKTGFFNYAHVIARRDLTPAGPEDQCPEIHNEQDEYGWDLTGDPITW